jgi:hypothetical protein
MVVHGSVVVHACNPGYSGGRDKRISVTGKPHQSRVRSYLKIKIKIKGVGDMLPSTTEKNH